MGQHWVTLLPVLVRLNLSIDTCFRSVPRRYVVTNWTFEKYQVSRNQFRRPNDNFVYSSDVRNNAVIFSVVRF